MPDGNPYIGRRFGNYKITAQINRGSSGRVYYGHHVYLSRVAAIKLLHTGLLQSRVARNKFRQEAQILERLKHPHILAVYEFGIYNGLPCLIMEYASGGSLRDRLISRLNSPLPLADAISVITQIGYALHYAHEQGVIHHDLKPENVLFNSRGEALLADFGIAIIKNTATLEFVTEMNGTPAYMAPEQFQGKVSKRSDQYALGCITYELVTGRRPFIAPDAFSMGLKHLQESPIPPSQLNTNLSTQIDYVILKALEKQRINRYPDTLTFIQELQALSAPPQIPSFTAQITNTLPLVLRTKEHYLHEGSQFYSRRQYHEALAAYQQAITLDPQCVEAYLGKGNTLYRLRHYNEALISFNHAIYLAPHDAAAHNNRGSTLYMLGRYREALTAYNQALRLDPHLVSAKCGKDLSHRRIYRAR